MAQMEGYIYFQATLSDRSRRDLLDKTKILLKLDLVFGFRIPKNPSFFGPRLKCDAEL